MRSVTLLFTLCLAGSRLFAGEAAVPIAATGVDSGLCVVVGAKPAPELIALTNGGRMLVECLVPDRAAADALRADVVKAGQIGLITIKHQPSGQPLPYVSTTVNLLIADGPVDAKEVARVVAPFGATSLQGKVTRIPLPPTMDEWPQNNKDAGQSNWSADQLAGPPSGFRWISPMIQVGLVGGKVPVRVAGGRFYTYAIDSAAKTILEGRNAFNGTQLWSMPAEFGLGASMCDYVVANNDRLYTYIDRTGPLSCIDGRTGAILRTLEGGPKRTPIPPKPGDGAQRKAWDDLVNANKISLRKAQLILSGNRVVSMRDGTIAVFDETNGKRLWSVDRPGSLGLKGSVGDGRIYIIQHTEGLNLGGHRGTDEGLGVSEVFALDLETGRELWKRMDLVDKGTAFVFMPPQVYRDRVVLSMKRSDYEGGKRSSPNSTLPAGWLFAALDPATGATRWRESTKDSGGTIDAKIMWIAGAWINDQGQLWTGYTNTATGIDTAKGTLANKYSVDGNNCFWTRGISNWYTAGPSWVDTKTGAIAYSGIVRPDCNDATYGVYGGVLSSTSHCECNKWVQGRVMMSTGPMPKPLPDTERLETFAPLTPTAEVAEGWSTLMGDAARSGRISGSLPRAPKQAWSTSVTQPMPAGPLAQDWNYDATMRPVTPPVVAAGTVVVARGQQHTLVGLDAASGTVRWSTVLGGRIDSPPTLYRGHAYVGCRDGWLYAVSLADGGIRWRYLVASDRRQIVNASQLESLWPVLGTTLIHKGLLYATGGITCQHDGGLWVACVDPLTGQGKWRSRVLSPGRWYNSVRNEPLVLINDKVWMDKMNFDPLTGATVDAAAELLGQSEKDIKAKPANKDGKTLVPDDRIELATSGSSSWFGWPLGKVQFPGFSGSLMTMLMPGARTNNRGGTMGHWTNDALGHYRIGSGSYERKFGAGSIRDLTAWDPADIKAGMKGSKGKWSANTGSAVAMAMDAEDIVVIESGNGGWGSLYVGGGPSSYTLYKRSDGTRDGAPVGLPAQVTWRGIAAGDGQVFLSLEDGSVANWK